MDGDELVDDVTEGEWKEEGSLRQGREGDTGKTTGRWLAHFKGNGVARKAGCRLSGDRKLKSNSC